MNPDPSCEKDCRFGMGMSMTTCMYFPPVYDKHGNNINPDRNVTSGMVSCHVCDRQWSYSSCLGETEFKEITNA